MGTVGLNTAGFLSEQRSSHTTKWTVAAEGSERHDAITKSQ